MQDSIAAYDELTGAGNRRMLDLDLADAFARGNRTGVDHALVILDLDHFKSVNDLFGHESGDRVLKLLVELVQKTLRRQDRIYRMGGEEFVLLLPDTGRSAARGVIERLQTYLRARLHGPGGPVTASMGVAVLSPNDADWKAWLARADAALYRAKAAGRDTYVIDEGGAEQQPR